jgi:hypothetical protein
VNHDSIFAQIDAFAHRCHELLDVCSCVARFCSKTGTVEADPPGFTGSNSAATQRGMVAIRESFHVVLAKLRVDAGTNVLFGNKWKVGDTVRA